jgi:outer membrane protein OmpA-like peptidoglycan-associated protein
VIAAVISAAVGSCGGRTAGPPSAATNTPVPEAGTGSIPFAPAGAANDAGDGSNATGEPEADRDSDGIPDRDDRCPDTPGHVPDGCPTWREEPGHGCAIAAVVTFWYHSTRLTPDSDAAIRQVTDLLKANPCLNVELIGFVSLGEADPEKTGTARAAAVMAGLVHAGVDRKRLVAKYGGPSPMQLAGGASRVEFHMMNRGDACKVIGCPQE